MLNFEDYIENVLLPNIQWSDIDTRRIVLVLNNHSAHNDNSGLLEKNFEILHTPPQSCVLNSPIETCWSLIKTNFKRRLLHDVLRQRDRADFMAEIKAATREAVTANHEKLLKMHFKYILQYLNVAWTIQAQKEVEEAEVNDSSEDDLS